MMKRSILFLGQPNGGLEKVKAGLIQSLGPKSNVILVVAKDGPEAASKAANQKFDAVVIDPKLPRINEFLSGLRSQSTTAHSTLIVLAPEANWKVPASLTNVDLVLNPPCACEAIVEALAKALKGGHEAKPASSFAVDARVLNALVKATQKICGQFGIEQMQLQKPQMKASGSTWKGDIGASIAIQSRVFQGALVISFDESVYLKMVSMMLGEEYGAINEEIADAIGEISNMILGNAKSDFTDYDIKLTLPVILKKGAVLETPQGSADFLIPAETPQGLIYIEVVAHPLGLAA